MSDERDIYAVLERVSDPDRPLKMTELAELSDLNPDEAEVLRQDWPAIDLLHRRALATAMQELSEDNLEADFREIFICLLDDEDATVRASAARGLLEDTRRSTLTRLLEVFTSDPDPQVQSVVVTTLGAWALRAAQGDVGPAVAERLRDTLLAAYNAPATAAEVRRRTLETLGYFGDQPAVNALIEQAAALPGELWRQSTLCAMGRSGEERWVRAIGAALEDAAPVVRYEAARAAGELGDLAEPLVAPLARTSIDSDVEVATAAIWALGQVGTDAARRALQHLVNNAEGARATAAADALRELDFFDDPLSNLPFDEDDDEEMWEYLGEDN